MCLSLSLWKWTVDNHGCHLHFTGKVYASDTKVLYEIFCIYSKDGSELLQRRVGIKFDGLKMILSGDFNINFADDNILPLIEYLSKKF